LQNKLPDEPYFPLKTDVYRAEVVALFEDVVVVEVVDQQQTADDVGKCRNLFVDFSIKNIEKIKEHS